MTVYSGPRKPRWVFELLDSEDNPIDLLDGVTGGGVSVVAASRLGGSGSLTVDDRGQNIDWLSNRVRVTYNPGISGVAAWPVATMLFTSPTLRVVDGLQSYSVDLLSKLAVIDEDTVDGVYSLEAGTPIIAAVVELIQSAGESRISVTPSDATLRNSIVFDAAESKLTIINTLLEAAGYWSLWCDGGGQFRVEPYVAPRDRAVSFVFAAGEASIHKPVWEREQDLASVPNKFQVVGEGSETDAPLVGVAVNEDPDSIFSIPSRGRTITASETGVEGADQAVFDQLAQRRLLDAMSPVARLKASHAIVPLEPNQVVAFRPKGFSVLASVQRMDFSFEFDAQCDAEWRELL